MNGLKTADWTSDVANRGSVERVIREEEAIVTNIAGARDTIEEYVNVRGVPLQLIDTAGIHGGDVVERIGWNEAVKR